MLSYTDMKLAVLLLCCVGCDAASEGEVGWVAPVDVESVPKGDAIELAVSVPMADAQLVRFAVDGAEVGTCDPAQADEDCFRDDIWRWTVVFDQPGVHAVTATVVMTDGSEVAIDRPITAVEPSVFTAGLADSEAILATGSVPDSLDAIGAGYLDPNRGYHNVFGGRSWAVSGQRVVTHTGTPAGSVAAVRACMSRYGGSIRRWADHYHLSRASIVATAITESNCSNPAGSSDGLSSGPMQVTASTCSALSGLPRQTCRVRMHTNPDFSFEVGAKYMGSSYQVGQHRHDPPKIGAAYNAGSVRRSYANSWRMLTTTNHIDRFVAAYNAYRAWGGR